MMFFDDESRNIHSVSTLGVHCYSVPDGLNYKLFINAIKDYQNSMENEL